MISEKNLKFWGHNCFSITTEHSVLLIDPWFSNSGAFFGSWFQYPKNHHCEDKVLDLLESKKNSFIFISHEHQDHYDPNFLKRIPANATIIIPKYADKNFRDEIINLGRNLIELSDFEKKSLDDSIQIHLIISDIGVNHDSAIFIKTEDFTFLNQNDCKVFDRLSELEESVDFYSVQFSGATWHPSCFVFSEKRKKHISKLKVENKFNNVLSGINQLNPKFFLPSAGPVIFPFLETGLSMGEDNIFVHQEELKDFLTSKGFNESLFLKPGDYLNSNLTEPIPTPNENDINTYKNGIVDVWSSLPDELNLKFLYNSINERLSNIKNIEIKNCPILIFNFGGEFDKEDHTNNKKIFIDLNNKTIIDEFNYSTNYEEIISTEKYFNLMCSEGWQNVYLSLRAKVVRRPDIFNNDLNIFIYSDSGNIEENYLLTRNISKERMDIKKENGEIFEIDRFCPHQGADLCNAKITPDNMLICPRHGWKFDLNKDGENISSGESIHAVKK
jgi:UDP-MurNAc hydroxylase